MRPRQLKPKAQTPPRRASISHPGPARGAPAAAGRARAPVTRDIGQAALLLQLAPKRHELRQLDPEFHRDLARAPGRMPRLDQRVIVPPLRAAVLVAIFPRAAHRILLASF